MTDYPTQTQGQGAGIPANRATKGKEFPRATVLVADDNHDTVEILTRLLACDGMRVLQAYSGSECLEIVRSHTVDVLLLDEIMPGMDGFTVCAALEQIAPALPIILVMAQDDMPTRVAAMEAPGVVKVMVKPINHADLLARIRHAIERHRFT